MTTARRSFMATLAAMFTFRVLLALVVSTAVTTSVTGPLAHQAYQARQDDVAVAPPEPDPPTRGSVPPSSPDTSAPTSVSTTTSTTTTTTTSTTVAGVPSAPTTTEVPPLSSEGLFVSHRADHTDRKPLEEATVAKRLWVFFDGENARTVRYWIDNPTGDGPADVEASEPFDLADDGFDFSTLEPGAHTLLAEVTTPTGTLRRLATFWVIAGE